VSGYVFKGGDDGVGYYLDLPKILPLDSLVPETDYRIYRFNARQWQLVAEAAEMHSIKRSRRRRNADGTRKKKKPSRRKPAMKHLPDELPKDDSTVVPMSGTLGSRWWQKLGL